MKTLRLDLGDELVAAIVALAGSEGKPLPELLEALLRQGMAARSAPARVGDMTPAELGAIFGVGDLERARLLAAETLERAKAASQAVHEVFRDATHLRALTERPIKIATAAEAKAFGEQIARSLVNTEHVHAAIAYAIVSHGTAN